MRSVRKLFPIPVVVLLLAVPAALAASSSDSPRRTGDELMQSTLASHPLDSAEGQGSLAASQEARPRPQRRKARAAVSPQLQAIAACESGGDPRAVSANGTYRGKYQFSTATWQAVGGSGDPAAAPEAEQDKRAAILMARCGPGPVARVRGLSAGRRSAT